MAKESATVAPDAKAPNETQKEVEAVVDKESAMVAPELEAPKELANVATVQPEEEVAKESAVPDKAEKVIAMVLPEVSQEEPKELAGSDGLEQEGSMVLSEVQEGEMEGEYLVPAAKGGDCEEEESDEFLTHDDMIKIHCVLEHGRQENEKALLAIEDVSEAWMALKKVPHLILGETKEEKDKDWALLAGLSQLQREEELYHHEQQIKAQEESLNIPQYLAERKKRLDKLALERRKREEEEEKKLMKVMILLLLFLFITHYNIL